MLLRINDVGIILFQLKVVNIRTILTKRCEIMYSDLLKLNIAVLLGLFVIFACNGNGPGCRSSASDGENHKPPTLPSITIDGVKLKVEIVQDVESRQHGLMNREELPENQGMLFVFESTRILSFWMRNTFIPLDIAFIDDAGKIVDIQRMEPLDESKSYTSAAPALYALEVNAGWFAKNTIKVGGMVSF